MKFARIYLIFFKLRLEIFFLTEGFPIFSGIFFVDKVVACVIF